LGHNLVETGGHCIVMFQMGKGGIFTSQCLVTHILIVRWLRPHKGEVCIGCFSGKHVGACWMIHDLTSVFWGIEPTTIWWNFIFWCSTIFGMIANDKDLLETTTIGYPWLSGPVPGIGTLDKNDPRSGLVEMCWLAWIALGHMNHLLPSFSIFEFFFSYSTFWKTIPGKLSLIHHCEWHSVNGSLLMVPFFFIPILG
jgi:hypothetical protein